VEGKKRRGKNGMNEGAYKSNAGGRKEEEDAIGFFYFD